MTLREELELNNLTVKVNQLERAMFDAQADMVLRPDPNYQLYWRYLEAMREWHKAVLVRIALEVVLEQAKAIDQGGLNEIHS